MVKVAIMALLVVAAGVAMVYIEQTKAIALETPQQTEAYKVPQTIALVPPPIQPLPYSHKIHAGDLGIDCQFCHTGEDGPENVLGSMMTFPETETCMECHADLAIDQPSLVRLTQYHDSNQSVPWKRVYTIAKGVNWSHKTHLQAGVECKTCHGDVPGLEVMSQTTVVAAMASCISCHQAYSAKTDCQTCHAWPSEKRMLSLE